MLNAYEYMETTVKWAMCRTNGPNLNEINLNEGVYNFEKSNSQGQFLAYKVHLPMEDYGEKFGLGFRGKSIV